MSVVLQGELNARTTKLSHDLSALSTQLKTLTAPAPPTTPSPGIPERLVLSEQVKHRFNLVVHTAVQGMRTTDWGAVAHEGWNLTVQGVALVKEKLSGSEVKPGEGQ